MVIPTTTSSTARSRSGNDCTTDYQRERNCWIDCSCFEVKLLLLLWLVKGVQPHTGTGWLSGWRMHARCNYDP